MGCSLVDFANDRGRGGWAWHNTLDDETFNEIWDAMHSGTGIGEQTILAWLRSRGYENVTEGKIKGLRCAERR